MMLQLKVIWHLLNLCAIAFAWTVQGSSGFSVFAAVEEQNHGYTPAASPLTNGSFVQPPLTSHPLKPSPPRRATIPTVSPTQSEVAPSSTLPLHAQQSAASPKHLPSFPPEAPLHDLTPQKPTPTPSQASVPITVPNPASTNAPLPAVKPHFSVPIPPVNPPSFTHHGSSTLHPAISPSTSSLSPPVLPQHSSAVPPPQPAVYASPPSVVAIAPARTVTAISPTHDKTPQHLPSPSLLIQVMPPAMPSRDSGFSPASPRNLVPSHSLAPPPPSWETTPPITTPSPVSAPPPNSNHHPPLQYQLPLPAPIVSSPSTVAAPSHDSAPPPNATIQLQSLPPLPPIPPIQASIPPIALSSPPDVAPLYDLAPSTPAESHFSAPPPNSTNQPPEAVPPTLTLPPPDAAPSSHFSDPPPTSLVQPPNLPPDAVPPTVSSSPPEAAPPSHVVSSSPPTESIFSAPPPNATVSQHSSAPPPKPLPSDAAPPSQASSPPESHISVPPPDPTEQPSSPPPDAVPPTVPSPPPNAGPPSHDVASAPPADSLSASPPKPVPTVSSPPPNVAPPSHDVASSSPVESHSAPPPNPIPTVLSPPPNAAPPSHDVAEPLSAPPPKPVPSVSSPPPDAAPPSHDVASSPPAKLHSASPPNPVPTVLSPPPNAAPPSHDVASSPPTESHSAPPPNPLPTVSSPPPDAAPPSHDVASSPLAESHSAPPPNPVPTVSSPPPNAAPPSHDVASSPPTESHAARPPNPLIDAPNPPADAVPPTVSLPPPDAAPSHYLAPSSPAESHFSAPPPTSATQAPNPPPDAVPPTVSSPPPDAAPSHYLAPPPSSKHDFSTPPSSSSTSKNASHPPSGSVPSYASAPSTAAEPPLTASPPITHTFPSAPSPPVISNSSAPLGAPPVKPPVIPALPREAPSIAPEAQLPRISSPTPSIDHIGDRVPVPVAPVRLTYPLSPTNDPPEQGVSPSTAPSIHKPRGLPSLPPIATSSPPISQTAETAHSPSLSPISSINPTHNRTGSISPETSYTVPSPPPKQHGSSAATAPAQSPLIEDYISPVPMFTVPVTSGHSMTPSDSPEISPPTSEPIIELRPPILALPPPPPNQDCLSYTCLDPYTNTIPGSPCGCVLPMRVELRIGVALYTFFPLVPEFAHEVGTALFMKQSQVRVMGANAASDKPDKTLLLVDLVPLGDKFDNITAFLIFERLWNHQVDISKSLFGDYQVLYVQYPGLPASPPMAPSDIAAINGGPYPGENGSKINPLGVDVTKQRRKHRISGSLIAIIIFSAVGAMLMFLLLGWILLFRHRRNVNQSTEAAHVHPSSIARSTGPTGQSAGSRPSFSLSFESSVAAYSGSAKTFSAVEIERATDNFNPSRVLGEGGFGLVYSATLEDGAEVAVKVLKREDQQGGREFLAEIEMLSRLHHRNLVKLIGICAEEHIHCLIYELIPNGSVESHLHGVDKKTSPLDWASRLKIALGSARGLAYLHEDSSPRVIHRDFKASNILLEADFTPKVSDFGLARTAMDEDNKHISTRVMGTFGYVAPEYAMTGHLLVKSDVYSYGVVLLELLTGRKPVDMSQPSGQENLVAWTRPYLTTKEALKSIVDQNLGPDISFESVAKVAAIASMCVQPEVSHRPFMGEVVQALKLVCNECDDSKDDSSRSTGSENEYNERRDRDIEKALSVSDDFCETEAGLGCKDSGSDSFRRHSSSGPIGGGRSWRFWKRGSTTSFREDGGGENGVYRFWSGSH